MPFVPGRSISDNILLAQELLAGYNQMRLPERCTLKLDIQKAYDSVEWDFLLEGDPMSPYLFVLVMEIWSSLLRHRIHNATHFQYHWKCKELGLVNLCFADDVLIFCLKVNPAKSQIILSRAVQQQRQQILEHLGFQEGSLPIKYLGTNLKQLWRILQNDGTSIWVDWVQHYRLRHATIWTFKRTTGSWSWKKILKLRHLLQRGVIYKVGDGSSFSLWQDIWHERGHLCLSYPRGPAVTGLPLSSTLSSVLQGNQWCWPASTDADIVEIMSQLPPTQPSAADRICWISASGKYTLQSAKLLLQPTTPRVHWHGLIQGKFKIPRHGFILWLAFLERLSTMDKPWVPRAADACVLCDGQFIETHDHLFFKCWFSKRCLTILKNKVKFQWPYLEWKQGTTWASKCGEQLRRQRNPPQKSLRGDQNADNGSRNPSKLTN
ncbi:UNVERIFIED_CONTAM: hypothetical protein Sangu_3259000 [Sesamum angustifolium]|uniref:Reverse transcriptase zinc-binding domain-containing protein n=1 Tax=Sesamum angustifolium TaxID=2727405 RepID=A0AAW2JEH7_9LAMI